MNLFSRSDWKREARKQSYQAGAGDGSLLWLVGIIVFAVAIWQSVK
jgi:hypothetical protein